MDNKVYNSKRTPELNNQKVNHMISNKITKSKGLKKNLLKKQYELSDEQLIKEIEDPNNTYVKDDLNNLFQIRNEIISLREYFENIHPKQLEEIEKINDLEEEIKKEYNSTYEFTPYFNGLKEVVDEYYKKNNIIIKEINEKYENYERIYNSLGHETYNRILRLFEKYCYYGRTFTNYKMEYSQFVAMHIDNNLYELTLPKGDIEVIYNKIKNNIGENKDVSFEDFFFILQEISKHLYEWENDPNMRLKYLINNNYVGLPALVISKNDKKLQRWFYLLSTKELKNVVKKYIGRIYALFLKYCDNRKKLSIQNYIKIVQDKKLVPVFLSSKEVIYILNYIKYQRKQLVPKGECDFLLFIESICIVSLKSFDKYLEEGGESDINNNENNEEEKDDNKQLRKIYITSSMIEKEDKDKKYVENHERLEIFINSILQK